MKFETLLYGVEGRIATITIDRPEKRNTLSPQVLEELVRALDAADGDAEVGAIVLTGTGDKAFCAGGDLSGSMVAESGTFGRHEASRTFIDLFRKIESVGKPIVAKLNGQALGGGLGLCLACDIVVAADDVRMGTPEIRLGLFPHVIMATIFRNVSHPKKAWEMVLTGKRLDATEAEAIGMINHVVPRAELDERTTEIATKLAGWSPASMRLGRRAFHVSRDMPFEQAVEYLQSILTINTMLEDTMEGVSAFFQKRDPEWKGR